jgi:hypothetical protein
VETLGDLANKPPNNHLNTRITRLARVRDRMPVQETYAARVEKATKGDATDTYVYDQLPLFLRKQLSQILTECIGPGFKPNASYFSEAPRNANKLWCHFAEVMDREVESFKFENGKGYAYGHCMSYLLNSNDIDGVLSLIEICGQAMAFEASVKIERYRLEERGAKRRPEDGLAEINSRFKQHKDRLSVRKPVRHSC